MHGDEEIKGKDAELSDDDVDGVVGGCAPSDQHNSSAVLGGETRYT
jgi:hypothetical protein